MALLTEHFEDDFGSGVGPFVCSLPYIELIRHDPFLEGDDENKQGETREGRRSELLGP